MQFCIKYKKTMLIDWKTYTVPSFSLKEANTHNYGFVVCCKSMPISSFFIEKKDDLNFMS